MQAPLLKTKLHIPALRAGQVPRPRLIERLETSAASARLTLISAPAGFGKTTLLSEWIHRRGTAVRSAVAPPPQFAWLSLDAGDHDPTRFWTYLLAALQAARPGLGQGALDALHAAQPEPPPVELVLTSLINALADLDEPLVLILDDLHAIDGAGPASALIHEGLLFLVEHLPAPPGGLHLVLSGRSDPPWPLARLRARDEMTELRARDLRFAPQEAAAFLNETIGLGLSADDVAALDARTEGWIAGLQMAALALQGATQGAAQGASPRGPDDPSALIRAFSGSHRLVLDYLVQEVLEQQPPEVQAFLLQTSILERMSAPLCDAVLAGQAESQALLERLERDNLFVVPLDDERRWYRYHPLFADLLRRRLQGQYDVPALHRAASAWFEAQGLAAEAIPHALAALDCEGAAALVEALVPDALARGEFGRMRPWLEALPEDRLRASALLSLARAWTLRGPGTEEQVEGWLRRAEALAGETLLDPETADVVRGNAAFLRVLEARGSSAPLETQLALLRQAQRVVPESDRAMRGSIATWLGLCYTDAGDEAAADRAFAQAWQTGLAGKGHWTATVALYGRTIIARWHGELQRAAALCREALDATAAWQGAAHEAALYSLLGDILLEWNDLEGAERCLAKGLEGLSPRLNEIVVKARFARARLALARGRRPEIPDLRRLAPGPKRALAAFAGALEAWLCLMAAARAPGDPRAAGWGQRAAGWAASCPLAPDGEHWPTVERLVCARVRIAQYRSRAFGAAPDDLGPVLVFLEPQAALLQARGWTELLVQTWIVRAMALLALGHEADALAVLARALEAAAPGGYVRLFLDEGPPMVRLLGLAAGRGVAGAASILAHTQGAAPAEALADPLSAREREVLRLLPGEMTSTEMAEALVVSANTVRTHVQHIYQKLAVHSRYEAVARARELGLL